MDAQKQIDVGEELLQDVDEPHSLTHSLLVVAFSLNFQVPQIPKVAKMKDLEILGSTGLKIDKKKRFFWVSR